MLMLFDWRHTLSGFPYADFVIFAFVSHYRLAVSANIFCHAWLFSRAHAALSLLRLSSSLFDAPFRCWYAMMLDFAATFLPPFSSPLTLHRQTLIPRRRFFMLSFAFFMPLSSSHCCQIRLPYFDFAFSLPSDFWWFIFHYFSSDAAMFTPRRFTFRCFIDAFAFWFHADFSSDDGAASAADFFLRRFEVFRHAAAADLSMSLLMPYDAADFSRFLMSRRFDWYVDFDIIVFIVFRCFHACHFSLVWWFSLPRAAFFTLFSSRRHWCRLLRYLLRHALRCFRDARHFMPLRLLTPCRCLIISITARCFCRLIFTPSAHECRAALIPCRHRAQRIRFFWCWLLSLFSLFTIYYLFILSAFATFHISLFAILLLMSIYFLLPLFRRCFIRYDTYAFIDASSLSFQFDFRFSAAMPLSRHFAASPCRFAAAIAAIQMRSYSKRFAYFSSILPPMPFTDIIALLIFLFFDFRCYASLIYVAADALLISCCCRFMIFRCYAAFAACFRRRLRLLMLASFAFIYAMLLLLAISPFSRWFSLRRELRFSCRLRYADFFAPLQRFTRAADARGVDTIALQSVRAKALCADGYGAARSCLFAMRRGYMPLYADYAMLRRAAICSALFDASLLLMFIGGFLLLLAIDATHVDASFSLAISIDFIIDCRLMPSMPRAFVGALFAATLFADVIDDAFRHAADAMMLFLSMLCRHTLCCDDWLLPFSLIFFDALRFCRYAYYRTGARRAARCFRFSSAADFFFFIFLRLMPSIFFWWFSWLSISFRFLHFLSSIFLWFFAVFHAFSYFRLAPWCFHFAMLFCFSSIFISSMIFKMLQLAASLLSIECWFWLIISAAIYVVAAGCAFDFFRHLFDISALDAFASAMLITFRCHAITLLLIFHCLSWLLLCAKASRRCRFLIMRMLFVDVAFMLFRHTLLRLLPRLMIAFHFYFHLLSLSRRLRFRYVDMRFSAVFIRMLLMLSPPLMITIFAIDVMVILIFTIFSSSLPLFFISFFSIFWCFRLPFSRCHYFRYAIFDIFAITPLSLFSLYYWFSRWLIFMIISFLFATFSRHFRFDAFMPLSLPFDFRCLLFRCWYAFDWFFALRCRRFFHFLSYAALITWYTLFRYYFIFIFV